MRLSACIETLFGERPIGERLELVASHGITAVEFWDFRDKPLKELRQQCQSLGLEVRVFSGQRRGSLVDSGEQQTIYLRELDEAIGAAEVLGCRHLMLTANELSADGRVLNPRPDLPDGVKAINALKTLMKAVRLAEKAGVVLLLEALNTRVDHPGCDLWSYDVTAALVQAVDSPHLRILLDIYHRQIMEGNLVDYIRRYGNLIGHVHVADVPGRHEPGTGEINWKEVKAALEGWAPDVYVGLECVPSIDSDIALEAFKRLFTST